MAVVDIGGVFLLSNIQEFVLIKLDGDVVDVMVEEIPSYKDYVGIENGKKIIYTTLRKAMYGTMQAAILWYETYVTCLKKNSLS